MLILSKYKDYYDYLSGIYGIDEKLVLDRRTGVVMKDLNSVSRDWFRIHELHIAGLQHDFVTDHDGNWYWGQALEAIRKTSRYKWFNWRRDEYYIKYSATRHKLVNKNPGETVLNDKEGCAVLHRENEVITPWPRLSDFPITHVSPDQMYQTIAAWLSARNEPREPQAMTNREKIKSHGFDVVKSFRHPKP